MVSQGLSQAKKNVADRTGGVSALLLLAVLAAFATCGPAMRQKWGQRFPEMRWPPWGSERVWNSALDPLDVVDPLDDDDDDDDGEIIGELAGERGADSSRGKVQGRFREGSAERGADSSRVWAASGGAAAGHNPYCIRYADGAAVEADDEVEGGAAEDGGELWGRASGVSVSLRRYASDLRAKAN